MSYIDKTYIVDYQQFKEVRDWCKGKIVETDNGLKYHAEDFLINKDMTEGALRVSFSEENTMEDVEYLIENLVDIVDKIRKK